MIVPNDMQNGKTIFRLEKSAKSMHQVQGFLPS